MDDLERAKQDWLDSLAREEKAFSEFMAESSKLQTYERLRQSRESLAMNRKSYLTVLHKTQQQSGSPEPSPSEQ